MAIGCPLVFLFIQTLGRHSLYAVARPAPAGIVAARELTRSSSPIPTIFPTMATLSVPPPQQREQPPRSDRLRQRMFFWGAVLLLIVGILAYVIIVLGRRGPFHGRRSRARAGTPEDPPGHPGQADDQKYLHDKPSLLQEGRRVWSACAHRTRPWRLTLPDAPEPTSRTRRIRSSQSPPQNSAAPTSPDKGAGQDAKDARQDERQQPKRLQPDRGPGIARAGRPRDHARPGQRVFQRPRRPRSRR